MMAKKKMSLKQDHGLNLKNQPKSLGLGDINKKVSM